MTATVFCDGCKANKPYSIRPNGGDSHDLCCDDCHLVVATFNTGHPLATLTSQRDMLVKALERARPYLALMLRDLAHVTADPVVQAARDDLTAINTALSQTKEGGA